MAAESVTERFGRPDVKRPAYLISGHGSEHRGTFVVPYGCDIIVKNTTCTLAYSTELNEMLNGLLFLPEKVVRNPIGNMNDIIQILGSVGVYTRDQPRIDEHHEYFRYHRPTSDTCVNLQYHLLNVIFKEDEHGKCVTIDNIIGSGIIDLFKIREARRGIDYRPHRRVVIYAPDTPRGIEAAHRDKNRNIEFIMHLYRHSIYPTPHTINVYLSTKWREETEVEMYDMLYDLDQNRSLINVSQKNLCYYFPGVYYHNVCRWIEPSVNEAGKDYVTQLNNWRKGKSMSVSNRAANPLFAQRVFQEAALRRNYLHQYQGSRAFEEAQHVMNKKNCRNLEERITSIEERLETVNQSNASNEVKEREKRKIIKNTRIRLLRDILYDKKTKCVRREAVAREAIARAREASELSHRRSRSRSRSRSPTRNKTSKSRSRSPTRNKTHKSRSRSPRYKND
jgi:hypothetical protein